MIVIRKSLYRILIKNYLLLIVVLLSSCNHTDHTNNSNHSNLKPRELEDLIGKWILDSATFYWSENKFVKLPKYEFLTFHNDTDYSFSTRHGCIVDEWDGKYFILNNHRRRHKTITLVPNYNRYEFDNFDIIIIRSERLQIERPTEFINADDFHGDFTRKEIYRKIK